MQCLRVSRAGLIALLALALAEGASAQTPQLLPEDTAILRLRAPTGTTVAVDGRDFGQRREIKWTRLARGQRYRSRLVFRFADGRVAEREVAIQGGRAIELAVRSPGEQRPELVPQTGHAGGITAYDTSPDGRLLVTGGGDCAAIVWDVESRRALRLLMGHSLEILDVAFSPDGRYVATFSQLGRSTEQANIWLAVLWDAGSRQRLRDFRDEWEYMASGIAFSPDGTQLLGTNSLKGSAVLWNVQTGTKVLRAATQQEWPRWASQTPPRARQAKWLHESGEVVVREQDQEVARIQVAGRTWIATARFRPYTNQVFTLTDQVLLGSRLTLWNLGTGQKQYQVGATNFDVTANGRFLSVQVYTATYEPWLYQAETGQLIGRLPHEFNLGYSAVVSPDGTKQYVQYPETQMLDIASGQVLYALKPTFTDPQFPGQVYEGFVNHGTFSSDGSRFFTTVSGGIGAVPDVLVWDAASGTALSGISPNETSRSRYFSTLAVSPDGTRLVARVKETPWDAARQEYDHSREQWYMTLWDTRSARLLKKAAVQDVEANRAQIFSPGGSLLVESFNNEFTALLWETAGLRLLRRFENVRHASFNADGSQLLTCGVDGVLRLYDTATLEEVLALTLLENDEWLVTTPDGLFDGSPEARNRVAYRVAGQVVPVDRFFQDFYRPGLREEVFAGARPVAETDIGHALPPSVRIVSPPADAVAIERQATIEAQATDQGGGIAPLRIYQNGARLLADGQTRQDGQTVHRTFRVTLIEGENRFRVTSATADESWESEPAEIVLRYEQPLERPNLHLLVVGVSQYADAGLNLKYAATDAKSLAALFESRGGALYENVSITPVLDEQATRAGITEALRQVAGQTRPQDMLVLFLAGHGAMVGQRYYFVPHDLRRQADALEEDLRQQGLPADELCQYLGSAPALKRVLVLDTCASGGALRVALAGRGFALRGAVERLSRSQGVFTIAAAAASQEAQESD